MICGKGALCDGCNVLMVCVQIVFSDWIFRVVYVYYFLYCTALYISSTTDPCC
jgi:hypothetical protein